MSSNIDIPVISLPAAAQMLGGDVIRHALAPTGPIAAQNTVPPLPETPLIKVDYAPRWTSLFKRDFGWYGGDGIFTVAMDSDKTLFFFSDTMISE